MRRIAALLVFVPSIASADDPRDVFGIPKQQAEAPIDCSDGRDFGCARPTDPLAEDAPLALATWLPAKYLLSLPVGDATHDQVAHYAMGAGRDDAGVVLGGATGLENRWTVDGAPTESVRTGAAETRVPLAFLDGMLVTAGGFTARDRTSTGGVVDARLRRGGDHHELEAYVWGSLDAPARQLEPAVNTYQVRRGTYEPQGALTLAVVGSGPLADHVWYAAGIAPSLSRYEFTWTAGRLVDRDGDGLPDGLPGLPAGETIEQTSSHPITYFVPAMLRAGYDRGPHHVELTLLGSAQSDTSYLFNSTLQAAGVDQRTWIGDAIATYRGEWQDTKLRAQLAWHHSSRTQSARDAAAANVPQLLSAYVPATLPDDPQLGAACNDNAYPGISECPVPAGYFASAGAGELVDTTADRPSITVDVAHRIGSHVARAGVTGEDARLTSDARFTGGELDISLFPGVLAQRQFLDPNVACSEDPAQPCQTAATSQLSYRTRYTAAYVEDTWHATPDLLVDGGLRWELMWVGTTLHFSNELAPRFGASWDPLGNGRARVWTSAGRSFALLSAGLGRTILGTERYVDNVTTPFGPGRTIETGAPYKVVPGIAPTAQDELTLGGEVALARAVKARAWLQGRYLARGIELTPDGLDDPGRNGDPPASRDTELVALELATSPAAKLVLRIGYLYATTIGSWVGPYDPREGAILYASTDYQVSPINLVGPLPQDLGHRFYMEASRRGKLGEVAVAVATRLTVASGKPRDALAEGDAGLIYLIPRGTAGSDPLVTQANVRFAASWRGFDATLDLVNLFDRRTATYTDPLYASDALSPIDGGSYGDLVFLRTNAGALPARQTTYERGMAFQAPFSAVLGLHRAF